MTSKTTKIQVKPIIEAEQAQADLQIKQFDLSGSMMVQAGFFAHYSRLSAEAELQYNKLEQLGEIIEARLDTKIRDRAVAAGVKTTEAQVKAAVSLEPEAIRVRSAINEARMVASIVKSTADAFRHKKDMLIQLGADAREEMKGQLRLNGPADRAEAQRQDRQDRAANFAKG